MIRRSIDARCRAVYQRKFRGQQLYPDSHSDDSSQQLELDNTQVQSSFMSTSTTVVFILRYDDSSFYQFLAASVGIWQSDYLRAGGSGLHCNTFLQITRTPHFLLLLLPVTPHIFNPQNSPLFTPYDFPALHPRSIPVLQIPAIRLS